MFAVQAFCALFFAVEALADAVGAEDSVGLLDAEWFETVVTLALVLGVGFSALRLREILGRQRRMEQQLKAASADFAALLEEHFDAWGLTPSERDVALLSIKGLSIAEVAQLRNTKEGTVKAQCNAVYRKAGVTGRPQLLSLFIEALTAERLAGAAADI